jgi:diacylglycerol kinase (ATP)
MDTTRVWSYVRGLIVANPHAGSVTPELVDDVVRRCDKHVGEVRLQRTTAAGDAVRVVRSALTGPAAERPDLVVAVGGDGTVREVVTGLIDSGHGDRSTLFVVPAGTGNSNYLAQWGDIAWPDALDSALGGEQATVRRLDLARLVETDALVLLGACSGIVAEALQVARELPLTGRALYQEAFTRTTRTCVPYSGRVIVDGRVVHEGGTILANVGGGRFRGGTYKLLPQSILDDGELDVCVIGDTVDPLRVPELIRAGDHLDEPGVVYARGRRITVERTDGQPLWFEHDGELLDRVASAYTLEVLPGALPVLCRTDPLAG